MITVQVSGVRESLNSYGCLVDLLFDANGRNTSAARNVWFPKSLCSIQIKEPEDPRVELPSYFLTAPKWLLDKNEVKYDKE